MLIRSYAPKFAQRWLLVRAVFSCPRPKGSIHVGANIRELKTAATKVSVLGKIKRVANELQINKSRITKHVFKEKTKRTLRTVKRFFDG